MYDFIYNDNLINRMPDNSAAGCGKWSPLADQDPFGMLTNIANASYAPAALPCLKLPLNKQVALVYGFEQARNLSDGDGVKKFTIHELNDALAIDYISLDHEKILNIQQGITVNDAMIDRFFMKTGIAPNLGKELLLSWSLYMREHYEFISVKERLERKTSKCGDRCLGCLEFTLKKNNTFKKDLTPQLMDAAKDNAIAFLQHGDVAGFNALRVDDLNNAIFVDSVVKTLFFRRLSKLALKWSNKELIAVNFDVSFSDTDAIEGDRSRYRPITFSEYKYFKKNDLDNVFVRTVHIDAARAAVPDDAIA